MDIITLRQWGTVMGQLPRLFTRSGLILNAGRRVKRLQGVGWQSIEEKYVSGEWVTAMALPLSPPLLS